MKTSIKGINLIKEFEGLRLCAYKATPSEKYYTIGYGHYSADVTPNMTITKAEAESMLTRDLAWAERAVGDIGLYLTQNEFDALVSFTFNLGTGNLKKLTKGRNKTEIADAMLLYNKAGGKELAGLTRRRKAERSLFLESSDIHIYAIMDMQELLNKRAATPLVVDGIIGNKTKAEILRQWGVVVA